MKLIERMEKDSKGCNDGWRRKLLAEVPHGYFGSIGGPNGQRGVYASIGPIQIEGTNEEMEEFAQAIMRKVARNKEWENDERIEKVAAQLAHNYLVAFGDAIHKGESPESYPLLGRDFSTLSAGLAFKYEDVAALQEMANKIIRNRLTLPGYEKIAEAIKARK